MSTTQRNRLVNPRLGTYFGIFVSAFVSLLLISVIAEQLGVPDAALRWSMLLAPLSLYAAIGIAAHTQEVPDFFAAGRRVPAFFTGLAVAVTAIGGVGFVSITGLMLLNGFDALCIVNGVVGGFVVCAVAVAPYIRKFGSYSVPSYLGRRFDSRLLRVVTATLLCAPLLLFIIAELKIGLIAATWLTGASEQTMAVLFALTIIGSIGLGGMRSLSWSGTAAGLAVIIAIIVPAAIAALEFTNLPIGQFTHGPVMRSIGKLEYTQGIPVPILSPFVFDFAGTGLEPVARRIAAPFTSIGSASYVLTSLMLMMGVATAPWLLPRIGATPGVFETRKSLGWAVFAFGSLMLTLAAVAVFERSIVMKELVGQSPSTLPEWFSSLVAAGHAAVDGRLPKLPLSSFAFKRDAALFTLPVFTEYPAALLYLGLAGGVAAAFASASATIFALGLIVAEDGFNGGRADVPAATPRLLVARAAIVFTAVIGALLAVALPGDPLMLVLWALGLSGATLFPVIMLSIWWKRLNAWGALAGVVVGFVVAFAGILAAQANWTGIPSALVSIFAVPAGLLAAAIGARIGPAANRHVLELVRDMRVPGGETVYDREQRLLRLKQRQRAV